MILWCASSNHGKLREFRLAASSEMDIQPLAGLTDIAPPEENGSTFEENAVIKAVSYGAHTGGWLFVDDSGLEVDALGGAPGVNSARYSGTNASDAENRSLLLQRMKMTENRSARFVCVIALVHAGKLKMTFRGTVEGEILRAPRGTEGFGYDSLFYFPPFGCSFGEADAERKQTVSHRGRALHQMLGYLRTSALDDSDRFDRK